MSPSRTVHRSPTLSCMESLKKTYESPCYKVYCGPLLLHQPYDCWPKLSCVEMSEMETAKVAILDFMSSSNECSREEVSGAATRRS